MREWIYKARDGRRGSISSDHCSIVVRALLATQLGVPQRHVCVRRTK